MSRIGKQPITIPTGVTVAVDNRTVTVTGPKGNLTLTGNLGDVMKESATIAYEYLKSHSDKLNIEPERFEKCAELCSGGWERRI